jgi:hypothetical protein
MFGTFCQLARYSYLLGVLVSYEIREVKTIELAGRYWTSDRVRQTLEDVVIWRSRALCGHFSVFVHVSTEFYGFIGVSFAW